MKKSFWNSPNFWTQVATLLLSIFAIGGANFDAAGVSEKLVDAIWSGSVWAIGGIVVINLVNPIYHWAKTPQVERWAFLHSLNWWANFGSVLLTIPVAYGIFSEDAYQYIPDVVKAIAARDWTNLVAVLGMNFILPLIKIFVFKPKVSTT